MALQNRESYLDIRLLAIYVRKSTEYSIINVSSSALLRARTVLIRVSPRKVSADFSLVSGRNIYLNGVAVWNIDFD